MTLGYKSRDYREKKRWETKKIDIERGKITKVMFGTRTKQNGIRHYCFVLYLLSTCALHMPLHIFKQLIIIIIII